MNVNEIDLEIYSDDPILDVYLDYRGERGPQGPQGPQGEPGYIGNVDLVTFDVVDGNLIMYSTKERNYTFQLNDNKLEVVYNG